MTRILLVEDHVMVRQSIRAFLEGTEFEVIGEAGSGQDAVRMAAALHPALILMDIHLPDMNGIEATRRIRIQDPDVRIIALTAYNEKAYQRALSEAGAQAFVLKTAQLDELLTVIRKVLEGADSPLMAPLEPAAARDLHLTERELEVLKYAARGWTNKQIGYHLNISSRTVQVHLQATYQKLGVSTRTEAVSKALALGMISMVNEGDE